MVTKIKRDSFAAGRVTRAKRAPKQNKIVRLTARAFEWLEALREGSGRSEGVLVDEAIQEYMKNHPEYWTERMTLVDEAIREYMANHAEYWPDKLFPKNDEDDER